MPRSMTAQSAEILGLQALAWLAGDPVLLERFTNGCGIDGAALRAAADHPETIASVLDFLLADEALLLAFCSESELPPQSVQLARHRLEGNS
jgi:Protein of unknown function (DUF3572)